MFGLEDLKQTRYFQDVAADSKLSGKLSGKLESVPRLLKLGLTVEQIAGALELNIEAVREAAEKQSDTESPQN